MAQLRGSDKYIWSLGDVLGQGSTGAVYQGRNKKTGELVAVKTFNPMSQMRPRDVQLREFEVMRKLNHDNIVRLLDIEKESGSQMRVLVMELCTGGSLFNMLDAPENAFGIPEDDFFIILNDIACGLNHLKERNMVHRDIKPGNILRYIAPDGRAIYKLTDFGAARELEEEEEFMSLYGTEEYLYPDMYEKAVLRRPSHKTFDASVDMWSLGVTLYHLATGQLPFRPHGGRKNKETMHRITTEKRTGVISGVQEENGGPIIWSKDLPPTTPMSSGGRKLLYPLLAGLMEVDSARMWDFEQFYQYTKRICCQHPVHVFDLCHCKKMRVYVNEKDTLAKLEEGIAIQTDIRPNNQTLLMNNCPLDQLVTPLQTLDSYPGNSDLNPLLLFYNTDNTTPTSPPLDMPTLPPCPNELRLDRDPGLAKTYAGSMCYVMRQVEMWLATQILLRQAADMYFFVLRREVETLHNLMEQFKRQVSEMTVRLNHANRNWALQSQLLTQLTSQQQAGQVTSRMPDIKAKFAQLTERVSELDSDVDQIYLRAVKQQNLKPKWADSMRCRPEDRCVSSVMVTVEKVKKTWADFKKDRNIKSMTFNEEQIHRLEKNKMSVGSQKCITNATQHCHGNLLNTYTAFTAWYREAFKASQSVDTANQRLAELSGAYDEVLQMLVKDEGDYLKMTHSVLSDLPLSAPTQPRVTPSNNTQQTPDLTALRRQLLSFNDDDILAKVGAELKTNNDMLARWSVANQRGLGTL